MSMIVQVKCYLFPCDAKPSLKSVEKVNEIRRFDLISSKSFEGLYDQLADKISKSFGSLVPDKAQMRTYWQDDENELVGFSSDAEMQYAVDLQTAIRSSSNSIKQPFVFKVYICRLNEEESGAAKSTPTESNVHVGVVCDGCNGAVVGTRHKCAICPDYDLCNDCRSKGIHRDTEHAFNKIEKPISFWRPTWSGARRHHGVGAGRCPFKQQQQKRQQQQASANGANFGASFAEFQNQFNQFLPQLSASLPIVNNPEQLKSFGENLKKFLDPFGIDVDYYVDNLTRASEANQDKNQSEKAESASTQKSEEKVDATPKENKKEDKQEEKEKIQTKQDEPEAKTMDEDLESLSSNESIEEVLPETPVIETNTNEARAKYDMESNESDGFVNVSSRPVYPFPPKPVNPSSPYAAAANALKSTIEMAQAVSAPPAELVTEPKSNFSPSAINSNHSSMPNQQSFNFVDMEKEMRIIRAVDALKSMGYTDENGWLTHLVTIKDGNLNAILDAMSAPSQKK